MIKRIVFTLIFLLLSVSARAVDMYNILATAYVTTTISQNVVFDSTMQQGGTFTFSVLAHNGGGRAGQSDTANVKIQFYTASNALVSTVNTSYSANLPNPNAVCGNPCIDPAVPWTTLTISSTLTAAQASTVAYAKISMYGIDGSYWAGDYGPWYRAPTFTLDGGPNMAYNPEFGPYNNVQAQGWTTSPAMGACQGAWGGSNPCIVNSSGQPGTSTVGLTANQNGGGPSATGGTTSGQPGGYNSTMTTTNASGAPPAPTLVSTVVTYSTRSTTSGDTTTNYRTPITTKTYSDGTTQVTNGTEALYSTAVNSNVTTTKIENGTLTVYTTPITTTTLASDGSKTVTANGAVTTSTQSVQKGLNFNVWKYDYHTYTCIFGVCLANIGAWTWNNPSMNRNDYGNPVNSGVTSGMYVPTNSNMPNNGSGWGYADGTVINYTGTITAPITSAHPAGSVYRLYFYNQSDDGFVLNINGQTVIFNNSNWQLQGVLGVYNDSGWIDVVAGQSYNLDAWYWNTEGGWGLRVYWDFGSGVQLIPEAAFSTGWVTQSNTIDTTGVSYSNGSVVNITGTNVGPTIEGGTIVMTNSSGNEVITSGSGSTAGPTIQQQTRVDSWINAPARSPNNSVNLNVNGSNNAFDIEQVGPSNTITGIGEVPARVTGSNNTVKIRQGTAGTGQNEIQMRIVGDQNNLDISQARTDNGTQTGTNGHYQAIDINGHNNTLTTRQSNGGGVGSQYQETTINGNQNNVTAKQTDNGNKIMFTTINGNNNTVDATQRGTGQHYLETKLTGNGNSALVVQEGNTANKANIDLTNAGGAASIDLLQSGGKNLTIQQTCVTSGGCGTTIRQ